MTIIALIDPFQGTPILLRPLYCCLARLRSSCLGLHAVSVQGPEPVFGYLGLLIGLLDVLKVHQCAEDLILFRCGLPTTGPEFASCSLCLLTFSASGTLTWFWRLLWRGRLHCSHEPQDLRHRRGQTQMDANVYITKSGSNQWCIITANSGAPTVVPSVQVWPWVSAALKCTSACQAGRQRGRAIKGAE